MSKKFFRFIKISEWLVAKTELISILPLFKAEYLRLKTSLKRNRNVSKTNYKYVTPHTFLQ